MTSAGELSTADWARALSRASELADLDKPSQCAQLASLEADDPRLAGAVRSLLAEFDEDSVDLVEEIDEQLGILSPSSTGGPLPSVEGIELSSVLGHGGSGDVYVGYQAQPGRDVAVKVLRSGLGTPRAVHRFAREARALATIDHPAVASIYAVTEAVLPTGAQAPCLVMELVQGSTLKDVPRPLGHVDAIALVSTLARGLHAAHQRGVVHRDMKPSNIILTPSGSPKIIDFGVAAFTVAGVDESIHTITGELLGTLGYMSPEQLDTAPDVADVRTDVYALGILLYELITGRPAVDVASSSSLGAIQAIAQGDLPRIPGGGDLDAVYRKATERETSRRYESAAALADDLDRLADGRPVQARSPTLAYLTRLFLRRHPRAVIGVGAALATVVALTITTSLGFVAASQERDAARIAERRATRSLAFLQNMLASPDPDLDGPSVRVVDLMNRSEALVADMEAEDPLVAFDLHRTIGWTFASLSEHGQAVPHLERAVELAMQSKAIGIEDTLDIQISLADSYVYVGDYDAAMQLAQDVVVRADADAAATIETRIAARVSFAEANRNLGNSDAATEALQEALDLAETFGDGKSEVVRGALSAIGRVYLDLNRASDAAMVFAQLVSLAEADPDTPTSTRLTAKGNLGISLAGEGRHEEAIVVYEEVLDHGAVALGEQHFTLRMVRGILPDSYLAVGRDDDAINMSERALIDAAEIHGPGHPDELLAVSNHAVLLLQLDRAADALSFTTRLNNELPGVLGPDHPRTLIGMRNHAAALDKLDRDDESAEVLYNILAVQRASLGDDHFDTMVTKNNLAFLLEANNRSAEAVVLMREVLAAAGPDSGFPAPAIAVFKLNLARSLLSIGELNQAESELQLSLTLNGDSASHTDKVRAELDRLKRLRTHP